MSEGSLVYSNTAIASSDGIINIGHHTYGVYLFNTHASTNATVKLNDHFSVLVPAGLKEYVDIDGDYTSVEVLTANVSIAIYSIG